MRKLLKIPMQYFAEEADSGASGIESASEQESLEPQKTYTEAEYNAVQEELARLRAEHLSQEEQTRIELTQRETDIANREAALRDKENRLHAVQALESAGLCSFDLTTSDLMPFVMDSTSAGIDSKVKALSALFEKREKAQTDKLYRDSGRQPQQIDNDGSKGFANLINTTNLQAQSRAKEIREMYTGGKK